ncbi:ribonuclease III [Marinoscillum sp. MHG1-6]|uniref:ribonuclease III n=1 Tax=Marinoscillum sp. MHG1-6 TaxID=2959627 RepID=UPI002157088A|nr:ribonuclease III [Marinoscillum sp. MHG1-6]
MLSLIRRSIGLLGYLISNDKELYKNFKIITGNRPINLSLYTLAMRHTSAAKVNKKGVKESYERLEFLGDSILGMVVAEMLYKKFPFKDEGFLTETRSKLVNRETLNQLSKKIGLQLLVKYNRNRGNSVSHKSVYGDSLEALIGAIYLDRGYWACKKFIIVKLITPHFDLDEIAATTINHKSKIIEWAQKEDKNLKFEILQTNEESDNKQFIAQVFIDDTPMEKGFGFSKKKAEQDAAQKTLDQLDLDLG